MDAAALNLNCASGRLSADCQLGKTAQQCQAMCSETCSAVSTEEALTECMAADLLLCCAFNVDVTQTFLSPTPTPTGPAGCSIEVDLESKHLDWTAIKIADIVLILSEPLSSECADGDATITHLTGVNGAVNPTVHQSVTWSGNKIDLPIVDLWHQMSGVANSSVRFDIQLLGPRCRFFPTAGWIMVASRTTATYKPRESCKFITNCNSCREADCDWCSWTPQVSTLLPAWVPDWSRVNEARSRGGALCGIHRDVCSASMGTQNACAAKPLFTINALLFLCLLKFVSYLVP
eukprot:Gregarina_sp_Poly_1__10822@NODE_835_length_6073_cov_244_613387_g603_i0_p4_GENE_NODE_835_length_6073_cov_244_613387_g603_i0NODE_835_length_6073_cov_244_613387_g603_i0_p4_ORF_typecomplete_len291_score28_07_NODE_835_length_6073_cov_244_613387_g603_i051135985